MLVYQSKVNNEVLSEAQYNELTEKEFEADFDGRLQDITDKSLSEYRANDSDFDVYDGVYVTDLGDYDLYTARAEDGNPYSVAIIKYHDNINAKNKIRVYVLDNDKELSEVESLADEYDDAGNADEKDVAFKGIEEYL